MLYFRHNELVERFRVSLKTVHNWIDAAKQGKLELQLHVHNGRTYIANTAKNNTILETQAEKGKKYRNTLHNRVVTPGASFYNLYNRRQILDIISNIEIHREIPRQYNYLDGGATNWDNWLKRLEKEDSPNILKGTLELIQTNLGALELLLEGYKRINIIDIGVGNARPVKELLEYLLKRNLLHRYVAIDISESMLQIAEQNIKNWFGDKITFEGHVRDITYERFDDLLVDDMLANKADETLNLVLFLGATLINFRSTSDVLRVVYGSMGPDDLLVYSDKPDTEAARHYFDFNPQPGLTELSPNHRFILDLMNIDKSLYDVEMGFNEETRMRYVRIRLKTTLTINFKFEDGEREVHLEKGDTILLLRVWHLTTLEILAEFEKIGFILLQSSLTRDRQFQLTISALESRSTRDL